MNQARAQSVLEAVAGKLFMIGGGDFHLDEFQVPSVEMYDILQNQWTIVVKEPGFPCELTASFVDGRNIVILGGYNEEGKNTTDSIIFFNTETRRITTLEAELPVYMCHHDCIILKM